MLRIYLDIDSLQEELGENEILDIVSFNVYESVSKGGIFTLIENVDFIPAEPFIEITEEADITNWFKLSYLNTAGDVSELSEPVLGEYIDNIIYQSSVALGDTDRDNPAFTDEEYILKIREGIRRYKGPGGHSYISEADVSVIILLVRISCCYDLAYDNSKYYSITLPEDMHFDKGQRVGHYIRLAQSLESYYRRLTEDFDADLEDSFEIVSMTRQSYFHRPRVRF